MDYIAWIFISVAAGAAGSLIFIVIDYLKAVAVLSPKVNGARAEIRTFQAKIDAEERATKGIKQRVAALQKGVDDQEKELAELQPKLDEHREREQKREREIRSPTRFKLE